ncbi:MAG: hypothetical protein K0Q79_1137 [Flavipsychrobacter sp.]|nr:hypothetical protein [Flavipsychrobacter sp.]
MKKIFTLAAALFVIGSVSFAQDAAAPKPANKKAKVHRTTETPASAKASPTAPRPNTSATQSSTNAAADPAAANATANPAPTKTK